MTVGFSTQGRAWGFSKGVLLAVCAGPSNGSWCVSHAHSVISNVQASGTSPAAGSQGVVMWWC